MNVDVKYLAPLALILVALFGGLMVARANLKAELAQAQASSAMLHAANDGFRAAAEKQALALSVLKEQSARQARRVSAAEQAAAPIAARYAAAAEELQKRQAGSDGCRSAEKLIDDYRGRR